MNSSNFRWYILAVPMKKEEYFFHQITETIAKSNFTQIGPCIVPTNSFFKSEKGEIKEQTNQLRGFIFIKTEVTISENNKCIPSEELIKLLNNFPKLKVMFSEPLSQDELNKMLEQEVKTEKKKVLSGFAKGCIIETIIRENQDGTIETEILSFGRKVRICLTKEELGNISK